MARCRSCTGPRTPLRRLSRSGGSTGDSVRLTGLRETQRALRRAGSEVGPQLKRELGQAAEYVRGLAEHNASHRSGRLGRSVRKSITLKGASVYSNLVYAYVQDRGGRVGRNHATLLRRDSVSQYMTRAVRTGRPYVSRRVEGMLDRLGRDFDL